MVITVLDPTSPSVRWLGALAILARATVMLPVLALRHPGQRLAINRASGRVVPR
jgi:hypothetical protein